MAQENNIEVEDEKEKIAMVAMNMILHAGDARKMIMNALDDIIAFMFDEANEKLEAAYKEITEAHVYQTECIQAEMSGNMIISSLLFAHAQDTLMTICTEYNLAKKMNQSVRAIDARLAELERREN